MRNTIRVALGLVLSLAATGCDGGKGAGAAATGAPESTAATSTAGTTATAAVPASAPPSAEVTAAPSTTASVAPADAGAATAKATATPAPSGSAAAGAKEFDCGAKGQKPCPMQGWMKSVMGAAASSGDGEKLASALSYVAARPPPGMGNWKSISSGGAAKAKAGDIEGAKASCKQCHDAYKATYKSQMRDRPF